jgi:putative transposase
MPNYRRARITGGTYFFTVVTRHRIPLLASALAVSALQDSFAGVMAHHPFTMDALVILPDHLHCIWTLPQDDGDFSTRWRLVKTGFFHACRRSRREPILPPSFWRGDGSLWQERFWEHLIRDQTDFNAHCDYIHYNPVKHGMVHSPSEWPHSTFDAFVQRGFYTVDWGSNVSPQVMVLDLE